MWTFRRASLGCLRTLAVFAGGALLGCSDGGIDLPGQVDGQGDHAPVEDGLADAYTLFKEQFVFRLGFDERFRIGYGFHPGLCTERLVVGGHSPKGQATLTFSEGRVQATLEDAPAGQEFELWFVKNMAGSGLSAEPEVGDEFFRVGTFDGATAFGGRSLDAVIGGNILFDLDMVVVTRAGQDPTVSRIAVGSRTLLEKRFFRERSGRSLDPVAGVVSNRVETTDPLVRRGAFVFFNQRFGGNGRTCGTCHRAEHNLTIDAALIATLPPDDPLFVAESDPALAQLENPALLRSHGLIREDPDGFDQAGVMRSVPYILALSTSQGLGNALEAFPSAPPDHRTGWAGDGAPGRGTLNEFAFGAIIQHFTRDMRRRPGTDFRIPTQEELDALEAFELFSGRQRLVDARALRLRDSRAEQGRRLFLSVRSGGRCAICHLDMGGIASGLDLPPTARNFNIATETRGLTPELPADDGFLAPHVRTPASAGAGNFNVPPLIEAADTPPFFHNNSAADIEAAVAFYMSETFRNSPVGRASNINITPAEIDDIASFLRSLNAGQNIRQVRKRLEFVLKERSSGNTAILDAALADTQDALDVLTRKDLSPAARQSLAAVKEALIIARAQADADRPAGIARALVSLDLAREDLFSSNPNNDF